MTAKKAGSWGTCGCGATYRTSNLLPMCGKCRLKVRNAEECRERVRRREGVIHTRLEAIGSERTLSRALAVTARERARGMGHDVGRMLADGDGAWIGYCEDCEWYVCVDVVETPQVYGLAQRAFCPGRVVKLPARRRNPSMDPTSTTSITDEAIETGPTDIRGGYWT